MLCARSAWRCLLLVLAMQRGAAASSPDEAVDEATHPFLANTLQVQPAYTDIRDGGNATQFLVTSPPAA